MIQSPQKPESFASLARSLGPVIYFIRSADDLVKIGFTTRIAQRRLEIVPGFGWDRVLAVVPARRSAEAEVHERFAPHRARGDEWYHPAPEILAHINEIRERLGVPPVTAW